jgi:hypothetical protein
MGVYLALSSIPDPPILVHSARGDHASGRHRKALSKCDAWKGQAVGDGTWRVGWDAARDFMALPSVE